MPLFTINHNYNHDPQLMALLVRILANQETQIMAIQDIRAEAARATTALDTIAGLLAGNAGGLNAADATEAQNLITAVADKAVGIATPPTA